MAWATEAGAETAPKSALGKALHYLLPGLLLNNAPGLSQTDEAWAEAFLPVNAPQEDKIPKP